MIKNKIKAFEDFSLELSNVRGGGYFEGTYANDKRCDSQYVTEKGETNQLGDRAGYDQYDAEVCNY